MLPQATADLYRADQLRVAELWATIRDEWRLVGDDLDAGWERVGPRITRATSAAMVGAAADGAAAVPLALAEDGFDVDPLGEIDPRGFGRTASDGRPLMSLLYGGVIAARTAQVASLPERLQVGQEWLQTATRTQVVDAARMSSQGAIMARPRTGWVRFVNPPCCQNCAILAGQFYPASAGFERHPNCDCLHRPAHADLPRGQWADEVDPGQITDLTVSQRKALDDGADLIRLVNKRRALWRQRMWTPGEAPGSRYGPRLGTPDWIYQRATSREHAMDMLRRFGYMRPPTVAVAA